MAGDDDSGRDVQWHASRVFRLGPFWRERTRGMDHRTALRVVTWNVQAERTRQCTGSVDDLGESTVRCIIRALLAFRPHPDIILLQELQRRAATIGPAEAEHLSARDRGDHALLFKAELAKAGYDGFIVPGRGALTVGTFWLRQQLDAERCEAVSMGFTHKTCALCTFVHRPSARHVLACNLHLSVPYRAGRHDPMQQMRELIVCLDAAEAAAREAERAAGSGLRPALVCAGDLNALPASGVCDILRGRRLSSAYASVLGAEPSYTTVNEPAGFVGTVDYVWYSHELQPAGVLDVHAPRPNALPDARTPSDHVPLLVDFLLPAVPAAAHGAAPGAAAGPRRHMQGEGPRPSAPSGQARSQADLGLGARLKSKPRSPPTGLRTRLAPSAPSITSKRKRESVPTAEQAGGGRSGLSAARQHAALGVSPSPSSSSSDASLAQQGCAEINKPALDLSVSMAMRAQGGPAERVRVAKARRKKRAPRCQEDDQRKRAKQPR